MSLTRDREFWTAFSKHAECGLKAAELLVQMMEHPERGASIATQISALEQEGDTITHQVVQFLHQTWITPLDREEIHALIGRLDDVLDFIDAAAGRTSLYEIDASRPESVELAKILVLSCQEIQRAMSLLQNMKDAKELLQLVRQINKHEHDADIVFRGGLARLFKERTEPLELMKWRDILETIETATDRAKDLANVIEGIVLEHG
jgi:predicted phosphate transport protein (TIGR00153 family)